MMAKHLGIGLIGSGFNAKFHLLGFVGVRNADVLGVWSPNRKHAEETAALALALEVGEAKVYRSITEMVADPALDALWLCGPNYARVENVEEIVDAIARGRGTLKGVACEKPLARNLSEAKRVAELVQRAGLQNGYLERKRERRCLFCVFPVRAPDAEHVGVAHADEAQQVELGVEAAADEADSQVFRHHDTPVGRQASSVSLINWRACGFDPGLQDSSPSGGRFDGPRLYRNPSSIVASFCPSLRLLLCDHWREIDASAPA